MVLGQQPMDLPHQPWRRLLVERSRRLLRRAVRSWRRLNLSEQFAIASGVVVLLTMSAIGSWVTRKIEQGVINNSAVAATLYMDAFVAPIVQSLTIENELPLTARSKLDAIMAQKELQENILSIKIWRRDAVVAYSNFPESIGRSFTPTIHFRKAWTGVVSAELDGHSHEDDEMERSLRMPLLEIYAPIRETGTNRIIAVSEFYVRADALMADLNSARRQSWAIVAGTALVMIVFLYLIVQRGTRTIEYQQVALTERARQNGELRNRIETAYWRADRLNEQFLRRLGADLHDGPAQLVGFALMTLDDLPLMEDVDGTQEAIRQALGDAIKEIRNMSRGLMLPELDTLSLNDTVSLIVRMHEDRTNTHVDVDLPTDTIGASKDVKTCAYRFIQEGLGNAYRHAQGNGQRLSVLRRGRHLVITISDDGPLKPPEECASRRDNAQLGLIGIRDRVETLSGTFSISAKAGGGTRVEIELDCMARNGA